MNNKRISCGHKKTAAGELAINNTARLMGKTAGELTVCLSKVLPRGITTAWNEDKERFLEVKSRMEKLFVVLGRTCYLLFGRKKNFMKEEKVKDLIGRIKDCQEELREMEAKMNSWQEELKDEAL